MQRPRILIAGVGNIFLGDDAFGVEVVRRLAGRPLPDGVRVADFGIRGFDLAFALMGTCDHAILVDALPRGGAPGTLYVLEPDEPDPSAASVETHGMHPLRVLQMVRALGGTPVPLVIVGCEPGSFGLEEEPAVGLTASVQAALGPAMQLVEELVAGLRQKCQPVTDLVEST
jgi:hydrogenase maturation protease